MREITTHRLADADGRPLPHALNDGLRLYALGDPSPGGASSAYVVQGPKRLGAKLPPTLATLLFQVGPPKTRGVTGLSNELLIAVLMDRIEGFQRGPFACPDNEGALKCLGQALAFLRGRARGRMAAENFPP